jgi:hypothetical protein
MDGGWIGSILLLVVNSLIIHSRKTNYYFFYLFTNNSLTKLLRKWTMLSKHIDGTWCNLIYISCSIKEPTKLAWPCCMILLWSFIQAIWWFKYIPIETQHVWYKVFNYIHVKTIITTSHQWVLPNINREIIILEVTNVSYFLMPSN